MGIIFQSLLNNTFSVTRRTRTADGQGGLAISYVAIGDVEGRIRPASGVEREVAAGEEERVSHVLYVVAPEDIERGDYVTCGSLVVEVLGIREPSLASHHWEIDCIETQVEVSA